MIDSNYYSVPDSYVGKNVYLEHINIYNLKHELISSHNKKVGKDEYSINIFHFIKETADYISRYASHPPISESNILSLDEDNHTITWTYTPHEVPDNPVIVTEYVFKFIAKLIRQIPDSKTHVLRYYGFYANRSSRRTIKSKRLFKVSFLNKLKLI